MKKQKNKIKKGIHPVQVSSGFYNYEKIFIELVEDLNRCETKKQLDAFTTMAESFKKKDAPIELVDCLEASIKNKMITIAKRNNIDFAKLKELTR